jgi:hypothetical protein
MDKALSDAEILNIMPEATLIMSPELKNLRRLPPLPLVILYTTAPNFGHWTLLHEVSGSPMRGAERGRPTVEFFDSYGMKPDDQLAFISPEYRRESDQTKKELVRLLLGAGLGKDGSLSYNEYTFQAPTHPDGTPVNTCGRWIILRYLAGAGGGSPSLEDFRRIAYRWRDPDEWAVVMTSQLNDSPARLSWHR